MYRHQLGRYFSARDSLCKDASSKLPIISSWPAGALLPKHKQQSPGWPLCCRSARPSALVSTFSGLPATLQRQNASRQSPSRRAATFLEAATQKPGFRPALQLSCLLQVSNFFSPARSEQEEAGRNKYLTEQNAQRLADALCRMRGAALKLGQMLSIQDEGMLPPQVIGCSELPHVSSGRQQGLPPHVEGQMLSVELWLPCNCMPSPAARPCCTGFNAGSVVERHPVRVSAYASVLGQMLSMQGKGHAATAGKQMCANLFNIVGNSCESLTDQGVGCCPWQSCSSHKC